MSDTAEMTAHRKAYAEKITSDFNNPELIIWPAVLWVEGMPEADKQWGSNVGRVKKEWLDANAGRPKLMMRVKGKRPPHPDAAIENDLKRTLPDTGLLGRLMQKFGVG